MVKNTTGGSKHKGQARKLVNAPVSNKIQYSQDHLHLIESIRRFHFLYAKFSAIFIFLDQK